MSPEEVFEKWGKVVKGKDNETYKIMASDNKAYGSAFKTAYVRLYQLGSCQECGI